MTIIFAILLIFLAIVGVGVLFGAPFVPTRRKWIEQALALARVGENDVVLDLGSGGGVVLRAAILRGAKRAVGYEINPILVFWSRILARKFNKKSRKISIEEGNLFAKKFPRDTTVIYLFQVDKVMRKIPAKIRAERAEIRAKKVRVVCFGFRLAGEKIVRRENGMLLYEF